VDLLDQKASPELFDLSVFCPGFDWVMLEYPHNLVPLYNSKISKFHYTAVNF